MGAYNYEDDDDDDDDNNRGKKDNHLTSFVGMVYSNHLYYCTDDAFVLKIANKKKNEHLISGCASDFYSKEEDKEPKAMPRPEPQATTSGRMRRVPSRLMY